MDVDGLGLRLAKIERLLDVMQPDWRDESNWPKGRRPDQEPSLNEDAASSYLVVDEERTRAERVALGYEPDPHAPAAPPLEPPPAAEWTDSDGGVWVQSPPEDGIPEKWVTEDGTDNRQEFIGSLDELKILTKPQK